MATKRFKMHQLRERFEQKFEQRGPEECWPWTAGKDYSGRGFFSLEVSKANKGSKTITAPRMAYILYVGPIDGDWTEVQVMHTCDNPNCVNPAHLRLGTPTANMQDMIMKKRARWQRQTEEEWLAA